MSREIKFRIVNHNGEIVAWEMFSMLFGWHHIIKSESDQLRGEATIHSGIYPDKINILYREQFIDMLDKLGSEIYENDMVKTPAGIGTVKWDKCYMIFWIKDEYTTIHDTKQCDLEVVCHINSNPELL